MTKRLLFAGFFLVFAVSLLSLSSAVTLNSCTGNDVIFKLSSQTNAHGGDSNSAYSTTVCYSQFLGTTPGSVTRTGCTNGNGLVLKLSATTNAHAEGPAGTAYNTNICYNNLNCRVSSSCNANERAIASLSATTNAHLAEPDTYTNKICCLSTGAPSCGSTGAACGGSNPACCGGLQCLGGTCQQQSGSVCGNGIIQSGETCDDGNTANGDGCSSSCSIESGWTCNGQPSSCTLPTAPQIVNNRWSPPTDTFVNRSVTLMANTQGFSSPPTTLTFEIYEADCLTNGGFGNPEGCSSENIRVGTSAITANCASNVCQVIWSITDADIVAGRSGLFEGDTLEFYFKATSGQFSNHSKVLNVTNGMGSNNPPRANITAPKNLGVYFNNTIVIFNESSIDPDGQQLTYRWRIDEDNFVSTEKNFTYHFTKAGQKTITLRVTDSGSPALWNEAQVSILVVASPGVIAYVSQPTHRQVVPATISGSSLRLSVNYNGSKSFVVNNVPGNPCPSVVCLAGNCPIQTENSPTGCTSGNVLISPSQPLGNNVNFTWRFDDGSSQVNISGLAGSAGQKIYARRAQQGDDGSRSIRIALDYGAPGIFVSSSMLRNFTLDACVNGGQEFIENNSEGIEIRRYNTVTQRGCSGVDGLNGTRDDCCPSGWSCGGSATNDRCVQTNSSINACNDYTSVSACNNDINNVVTLDPLYSIKHCGEFFNGSIIECACGWRTNECILNATALGPTTTGPPNVQWSCEYDYSQDECNNGYTNLYVNATFFGIPGQTGSQVSPQCVNEGPLPVICGRPTIELSFFDKSQFAIAALVLVFAYLAINLRRKR